MGERMEHKTFSKASSYVYGQIDKSQNKFFMVLIQGIERERSMTYYYRQIELTDIKVSARALFNALIDAWTGDDIVNEMQEYLQAFASDGGKFSSQVEVRGDALLYFPASTMRGDKNGLAKYLQDFTHKHLYSVHCAGP